MDAKEYLKIAIEEFGGKPEDWVQHPNGGGWVAKTAHVDETAYVGPGAIVAEQAKVFHWAQILSRARVYGEAIVMNEARVFGESQVCGNAGVYDKAVIANRARVFGYIRGYAWVSGNAEICQGVRIHTKIVIRGGKWEQTPLFIAGSKYDVAHCAPGYMQIGCKTLLIFEWITKGHSLAKQYRLTPKEVEQYTKYARLVAEADMELFGTSYDFDSSLPIVLGVKKL